MRLFLLSCVLLLSGCGRGGIDTVARKAVTSGATKFYGRALDFNAPPMDSFAGWSYYAANTGGLLIICGVIALIWVSNKTIGWRLIINGITFAMVAKLIEFFGDKMGWVLLICIPIGIMMNLKSVEKLLKRMGYSVDLNRDGQIGTDTIRIDNTTELEPSDAYATQETQKLEAPNTPNEYASPK